MNISIKTTIKVITLLVIATTFGLVATSCGDLEEEAEPEPTQEPEREADSYIHKNSCEDEHTVGGTSCPQDVCSIPVYCGKDEKSCTADSAAIEKQFPGLNCTFDNGETWTPLNTTDPKKGVNLNVEFTCAVAQTFEHAFNIAYFKSGVKVDQEVLKVKMTVK